ncbi:MAG: DNA mismatch repair protein MutL, partial [Proteiniphilum sp.]
FQVDPDTIDVNIHPTKTEVKFENEQALWQILMVTIKESLGKFNAVPTIDFDRDDAPEIPIYNSSHPASMPKVNVDPGYNPFHSHRAETPKPAVPAFGWEQLYKGFEREKEQDEHIDSDGSGTLFKPAGGDRSLPETDLFPEHYQYKQRYILTSVKSGLMMIDQHRAHVRILFDKYLGQIKNKRGIAQRVLFPEVLDLSASEAAVLPSIMDDLEALGFELSDLGNHSFAIQAVPSEIENAAPSSLVRSMIAKSIETGSDLKSEIQESIALSLANLTAIPYGSTLTTEEMLLLVNQLFASPSPTYTPDGKTIISVISDVEIEKKMQ